MIKHNYAWMITKGNEINAMIIYENQWMHRIYHRGEKKWFPNSDNLKCELIGWEDLNLIVKQFITDEESKCVLKLDV